MASDKNALYTIAVASTDFASEAYLDDRGVTPAILFSYFRDGTLYQAGFSFSNVAAVRHRAERCCKAWHIEDAYDTLVEVTNSAWAK